MAGLIYHTDKRRVIPQLERTSTYTETLNITAPNKHSNKSGVMLPILNLKDEDLNAKIIEWKKTKDFDLAGDILSQANLLKRTKEVEEIKKHLQSKFPNDDILNWLFKEKPKHISNDERIEYNFQKLKLEPRDSLTWTDQAINFLEINNREESLKCIENAIKINSNSGYIVRSASRIFNLTGDTGRAIKTLKNSEYYNFDPQILSAEISFSQIENRRTKGTEIGNKLIESNNYKNIEVSELASALGTTEYLNGDLKKSERLFNQSIKEPNKNSFAQYLWYKKENVPIQNANFYKDSNEIQTHIKSKEGNFEESLKYALEWKEEEPYSLRPYMVASQLSGDILGDFEKGFDLTKEGMDIQKEIKGEHFSEKDNFIFQNDLAYSLLKSDRVEEAEKYLNPLLEFQTTTNKLEDYHYAILATIGLLSYKKQKIEDGRNLYRKTIKHFSKTNNFYAARTAFLNFFEEEIKVISDIEELDKLKRELEDMVPKDAENDLLFRKKKALEIFDKRFIKLK